MFLLSVRYVSGSDVNPRLSRRNLTELDYNNPIPRLMLHHPPYSRCWIFCSADMSVFALGFRAFFLRYFVGHSFIPQVRYPFIHAGPYLTWHPSRTIPHLQLTTVIVYHEKVSTISSGRVYERGRERDTCVYAHSPIMAIAVGHGLASIIAPTS